MTDDVRLDVRRVLIACRTIELAMAAFYETLAKLSEHGGPMMHLWQKTACEESNHAAQFSLLVDALPEIVQTTTLDVSGLEKLHRAIEEAAERFRRRPPTVSEALRAAIDLEVEMDRIHPHRSLVFTDSRHQRMFSAMMASDSGHVAMLRAALDSLRTP